MAAKKTAAMPGMTDFLYTGGPSVVVKVYLYFTQNSRNTPKRRMSLFVFMMPLQR